MNGLIPYPDYWDSGLPWLGRIPQHWEVRRNARLFAERNETGHPDLPILEVSIRTGVTVRDMENQKRKQMMADRAKYKRAISGDVAYNMMRMWQGAVGTAPVDGLVSPAYVVAKPLPEVDSRYYAYLFRTRAYMNEVNKFSRGIVTDRNRLYWDEFRNMSSTFPPRAEQTAIADFLDHHASIVARFIRTKRQQIEVLNEQRLAMMRQFVARGIDESTGLRDSGQDWLDCIPKHWKLAKVGYLARFETGGTPATNRPEFWGGNIPWVSSKDMKVPFISETQDYITAQAVENSATKVVPAGSLLLVVRSGILRRQIPVAVTTRPVAINQDIKALTLRTDDLDSEYLMLVIRSHERSLLPVWRKKGATVESIEHGPLANTYVPVPPRDEQREIVRRIKEIASQIAVAEHTAERQITLIREYRKHLIADIVTGKLDVRNVPIELGELYVQDSEPVAETDATMDGIGNAEEVTVGDE